ncbi:hypothetical protein B2G74_12940 [Burkholderia sp. A27]|nr:hypothetical protein B2G74_12940 [Burkholderia sp. A27]
MRGGVAGGGAGERPARKPFARIGGIVWQTSRLIGGGAASVAGVGSASFARTPERHTGTIAGAATPMITALMPQA